MVIVAMCTGVQVAALYRLGILCNEYLCSKGFRLEVLQHRRLASHCQSMDVSGATLLSSIRQHTAEFRSWTCMYGAHQAGMESGDRLKMEEEGHLYRPDLEQCCIFPPAF